MKCYNSTHLQDEIMLKMHSGYKKSAKYGIRVENNFLDIEELLEVSTIQKGRYDA